jgi:hypothetical protein
MSTKISASLPVLAMLLAAGALSLPAAAQDPQSGMVVVRDAQTGKLRNASPAEVKALRAQESQRALVQPDAAPTVTIRQDGTLHKHLGDGEMVYSVTTRDADGKLGMQCVNGEEAANAALARPAPNPDKEHRHVSR